MNAKEEWKTHWNPWADIHRGGGKVFYASNVKMRIVVEAADRPRVDSSNPSTKIHADTPLVFQRVRFSKVPDHYHGVTPVLNDFIRLRG